MPPMKSFGSVVARSLGSRRHFSSWELRKNETEVGGKIVIQGSRLISFCGGYFLAGPLFLGDLVWENDEVRRKRFEKIRGESAEDIRPGVAESYRTLGGEVWSTLRGNAARMWSGGNRKSP